MAAVSPNNLEMKEKYRNLKRKLKFLIYENECFSQEIRNMEKRLLRVLKDRTFLLDVLTQHENGSPDFDSSDEDITDSSDGDIKTPVKNSSKKKRLKTTNTKSKSSSSLSKPKKDRTFLLDVLTQHENGSPDFDSSDEDITDSSDGDIKTPVKNSSKKKRLKTTNTKSKSSSSLSKPKKKTQNKQEKSKLEVKSDIVRNVVAEDSLVSKHLAGHMTPEEVERHLESRRAQQSQLEFSFAPDKAPATVPTEMFSNDLDGVGSYAEFLEEMETSPSNGGDEQFIVDMEHN
nr:EOG090X0LZH [Polyphemus pediculus]